MESNAVEDLQKDVQASAVSAGIVEWQQGDISRIVFVEKLGGLRFVAPSRTVPKRS